MDRRNLASLLLLTLLVACSQETPTPTPTSAVEIATSTATSPVPPSPTATGTATPTATAVPTPTETPAPIMYGPASFPVDVNPLTGMKVAEPDLLQRRPVAIKVNIVPRSSNRPPWGLSFADIVYDYYHNGGYARFFALFYGEDAELVGPIRSGRLLDHDLVQMYKSVFAYGSADQLVNNRLLNSNYYDRIVMEGNRSDCPPTEADPLCRFDPSGYDFLLGGTAELSAYVTAKGVENGAQKLDGMSFYALAPSGGQPASQVFMRYSGDDYLRWDYDPVAGRYLRFQDNFFDTGQGEEYAPLVDRLNNQQIAAENVVVVFARHEYYQQPPNEIIDILLSGSGKAYAFRDGNAYEVTWNRPTTDSVLFLTNLDGSNYYFKPGKTYFQIVGEFTQMSQESGDAWRFTFKLP